MNKSPIIESICELLKQAQEQTEAVLKIDGRPGIVEMHDPSPPKTCREGRLDMDRYLDEATWRTNGTGYQRLKEWVEAHWYTEKDERVPSGTFVTGDDWPVQPEIQLDTATATRKLIAAAKLYGADRVGTCAGGFAAHGMIEVHWFYLLKGPPIEAVKPLDDHCTLLPYAEALRRIEAETDPGDNSMEWPEPHSDDVCALHARYCERASPRAGDCRRYASPLLRDGPEPLAHLLGLVWGCGFRVFGNWHGVPAAVAATLPYRLTRGPGTARWPVALATKGFGPPPRKRPLAVAELHNLATSYSELTEQNRSRLERAMARLRNCSERVEEEDRVTDLAVALATLFMEEGEQKDRDTLVPSRAAWLYADSGNEKRHTEELLGSLFARHSEVLRGRPFKMPGADDPDRDAGLPVEAENVLRSCLKTIIAEGWPRDWNQAMERSALRRDPPRTDSEIPSVKSDSLSWSVEEQREIDRALEAVWKTVVEEAPPPPNMSATTVSELTPELVQRYRQQGIPYVVTHPARLYLAHLKWPRTPSDPLDERTAYYCERDVVRHTRQWREAALAKGLVQFEVPTDAVLYHPKHRENWPQPLLSSHEEDPGVGFADRPAPTVNTTGSHSSTAVPDTNDRQSSATKEESADPPSELPESTMAGLGTEWSRLWEAFRHEVNVATNSLLYMLEDVHSRHQAERRRLDQANDESGGNITSLEDAVRAQGDTYAFPTYPKLRALPALTGEPLFRRSGPDGPMEQTLMKAWLIEIYSRWESRYRTQLKHEVRHLPGGIRPRQSVLGDLGHIRNDLLHNGIAKQRESGRCQILRWFTVGEQMQVRLRHVFDFLNQMGWLHEAPTFNLDESGKSSTWNIDRDREVEDSTPALVSVRPIVHPEQSDPRYRYEASIVFENGVFGRTPMGPENEETEAQAKERTRRWMEMTVNGAGELSVPGLGTVSAATLYRNTLKGERRPAPAMPGPWIQFRE